MFMEKINLTTFLRHSLQLNLNTTCGETSKFNLSVLFNLNIVVRLKIILEIYLLV